MNPPHGREIGKWVSRANYWSRHGSTVVCLLPARTDTRWWHENVIEPGHFVRFLRGRVHFNGTGPAPFPSAVVVMRSNVEAKE